MSLPESAEEAFEIVADDVSTAFGTAFPGSFSIPEPFGVERIASDTTLVVPWLWNGTHNAPFLEIPATGYEVQITGVTMLRDGDRGELAFHRIVDWLHLYQQIGLVLGNRAPLDRTELLEQS